MTLLLMAAGRGSRYGKLKQFDDLGPHGEFLMEFSIYDALENGFDHVVVITQKANAEFIDGHLSKRLPKAVKLDVVTQEMTDIPDGTSFTVEREKPWGTAHAVWAARHVIQGPFVVINADDYYGKNAYKKAAEFIKDPKYSNAFALAGYTLKDTLSDHGSVSRGVCTTNESHDLVSVNERLKLERKGKIVVDKDSGLEFTGNELVSMNFWICRPKIFDTIENDLRGFLSDPVKTKTGELYIPFVIQDMLQNGEVEVKVIPSGGEWFGVTYSSDRENAVTVLEEMSAKGSYRSPLWG